MSIPPVPANLKPIGIFLKCAEQHDKRDIIIAYYCRLCAFQKGYNIDSSSQESKSFLLKLMEQLETMKASNRSVEGISSETVGLAHLENYALKLFQYAYQQDLNGNFTKATIQSFWTAGVLLDVATTVGQSNEELEKARKYAKWKSVYLNMCQKNGEVPTPGPAAGMDESDIPSMVSSQTPAPAPLKPSSSSPKQEAYQQPQIPAQSDLDGIENEYEQISPEVYKSVEKNLRFAISALQHQDKQTVVNYLQEALRSLTV